MFLFLESTKIGHKFLTRNSVTVHLSFSYISLQNIISNAYNLMKPCLFSLAATGMLLLLGNHTYAWQYEEITAQKRNLFCRLKLVEVDSSIFATYLIFITNIILIIVCNHVISLFMKQCLKKCQSLGVKTSGYKFFFGARLSRSRR